ncbi:hypothetical protein LJB85_02015 [Porphyromonadaceae bacterium OttesenSCG-928-L07]|nr:hypothetical protein [Porphyromonadaceae bacterium OttesenSCG-928-L07]MDL2252095.1 hypothetical protein [Odoribacter sp. OttesenSCG-928-J03]MDL2330842.1 hypothetical protein [Odoribacter sp. OttesenSCG-928-A06]
MNKNMNSNWANIQNLLSNGGNNLNIFEEEIDLTVQKEYFSLSERLTKNPITYKELRTLYIENVNDLFKDETAPETKKEMLVILSTVNEVAIYRAIESFSKATNNPLRNWGIIALQQSRMLIQSNLLDEPGIYISTGLGGHGKLLRYFCVFFNNTDEKLPEFQQNVIKNETEQAIKSKGEIEKIRFFKGYNTLILLLPIDLNLSVFFEELVKECNQYGNFLHENMIVTNVKKLVRKDIYDILKNKELKE